jgi:putative transposase
LSPHQPVHVTQRIQPGVGWLRRQSRARLIEDAMRAARLRFGLRVVHYSIQGNHLHLIVECESAAGLARGMQALAIRIAKGLNALARRRGSVFVDRYHVHALTTRREVANAVRYVLANYRHHARDVLPRSWRDPLSSVRYVAAAPPDDAPACPPRTWLLRIGWKLEPAAGRLAGHEP